MPTREIKKDEESATTTLRKEIEARLRRLRELKVTKDRSGKPRIRYKKR